MLTCMTDFIQLVDDNNQPTRIGTKTEAWQTGLYHQIVRIILKDSHDNILLQKRGSTMEIYPNLWTDSASGHVDYGERPEVAATRELHEELGIITSLEYIDTFLTELMFEDKVINTFNIVFTGNWDSQNEITFNRIEVSDARWVNIDELRVDVRNSPATYTPYLMAILERYSL